MLNKKDIEMCDNIRRYGKFKARYNRIVNGWSKEHDDTQSILVYEYQETTYYIVMSRGEYIDYLW